MEILQILYDEFGVGVYGKAEDSQQGNNTPAAIYGSDRFSGSNVSPWQLHENVGVS